MIILKFGGTSVQDAPSMRATTEIVRARLTQNPVGVSSACSGVTNSLLTIARTALTDGAAGLKAVEALRQRHLAIASELLSPSAEKDNIEAAINEKLDALRELAKSVSILRELTDRSLDIFVSFGEQLSTLLLSAFMKQEGLNAVLVDAQDVVVTNDDFTRATPLFEEIPARAEKHIGTRVRNGEVVVTQGFLGATAKGVPTTIGRGGSDYSAAILGAALDAEEIQIWTDVDGMMTSDPSKIPSARLIPEMTFREAAELAFFGAKVLHPSTIIPAVQKNIPVRILNSKRPHVSGTVIVANPINADPGPVKAIANKRGITLVTITSSRMLMMHGFLAKVFEIFGRHRRSVDVIATSEVSISLTLDAADTLDEVLSELRQIADVEVHENMAIFSVVGENLRRTKGVLPRIFETLEKNGIGVGMISFGASEINVTFVVEGDSVEKAARVLHQEFFGA